jgi:adenylate cyclase class IV
MTENAHKRQESREYEVEVRTFIPESDFDNMLQRLTALFGNPTVTELKTFLFRSPNGYGRIRIKKGEPKVTLTMKLGDYTDKARVEINRDVSFTEVDATLEELKSKGLIECSYLQSTSYEFSGTAAQKLFLSRHSNLGDFLEVESITKEKSKIDELHREVKATLASLELQELPANEYQSMMDQMYSETLKPASVYRDKISSF